MAFAPPVAVDTIDTNALTVETTRPLDDPGDLYTAAALMFEMAVTATRAGEILSTQARWNEARSWLQRARQAAAFSRSLAKKGRHFGQHEPRLDVALMLTERLATVLMERATLLSKAEPTDPDQVTP